MTTGTQLTAAIVLIGDELLSGKVTDVNGQLLIRELRALGVAVTEMHIVADVHDRIVEAINLVRGRNDFVFTSGGIGPTHDDRTMQAVAAAFGVKLEPRDALTEVIERYYGAEPDNPWRKMASVPQGCELILHEKIRWPIYKVGNLFVLPGIPEIFRRQFEQLKGRLASTPFHLKSIYVKPHEGVVARVLNEAIDRFTGVAIGSYPELNQPDYRVRVTIEAKERQTVEEATAWIVAQFESTDIHRVD